MILNAEARKAYAKAIAIDTQIDARVIRADGSVTATTAATFEGLKDASERAWAEYREAKDEQMADEQEFYRVMAEEFPTGTAVILSAAVGGPDHNESKLNQEQR